jgi:hypothetical protein
MLNGIRYNSLSQTFRDAVEICDHLEIQYLWIDALCIIQDPEEDWGRESASMGQIYKDAALNIAAADGENGHSPILWKRRIDYLRPIEVDNNWTSESMAFLHDLPKVTISRGSCTLIEAEISQNEALRSPLNQRGWVLQERIFSKQVLKFGAEQVFWQCQRLDACDMYQFRIPSLGSGAHMKIKTWLSKDTKYPQDVIQRWRNVVEIYSQCPLTWLSDKLVAISWLALDFQNRFDADDTYPAGLWKTSQLDLLLWRMKDGTKSDNTRYKRISLPGIPSWSWASVDGATIEGAEQQTA